MPSHIGRRVFVGAALSLAGCRGCVRSDGSSNSEPPLPKLPDMPEAGPDAAPPAPSARGEVGTLSWDFEGGGRAVIVVPTWRKPDEKLPVLFALHGRGEALKSPEAGALGWPKDYLMLRAIQRLCAPPLTGTDYEGFFDSQRLADTNASLAKDPFKGLVVVCPYVPDLDLHKPAPLRDYGRYLLETVLPRVRRELPVLASPAATGIDGVSLGGAIALRVGLGNPSQFGAVGSLQAAISEDQVDGLTESAKAARAANPALKLRLLTSSEDYFRGAIGHLSVSWKEAGVEHDYVDVPGPHDYPFNRGPGSLEMLLWHDRMLRHS